MKLRHRTRRYKLASVPIQGYGTLVHTLQAQGHSEVGPLSTTFGFKDIFMLGNEIIWRVPWT